MFIFLSGSRKFEGKCKGKKIQLKSRRKENVKEKKKRLKVDKLFFFVTSNSFSLF